jgi:sarcosine oxidase, subunit gamma
VTADPHRRSPLGGLASEFAAVAVRTQGRLRIAEEAHLRQLNVRARADALATAGAALGVELPTEPNTVATAGDVSALWLGPDEWLVLGGAGPEPAAHGWGVVDVSAQRTIVVLGGPAAIEVLAHGCALDLERMGERRCAQTMLARANVVLWRTQPDEFRILVRASFAPYLAAWLLDAAAAL